MKKIVALVLSLVMVLGLATTAFGAVKPEFWQVDGDGAWAKRTDVNAAIAADTTVADLDDLVADDDNYLPCYNVCGAFFAEVAEAQATYKLTYGAKTVFLAPVDGADYRFEEKASVLKVVAESDAVCGDYYVSDAAYDEDDVYYASYNKNGTVKNIYVADKTQTTNVLVNGKLVAVDTAAPTQLTHAWVGYDVVNYAYTTVKCVNCGKVATLYANATAAGKGAVEAIDGGWITKAAAGYTAAGAVEAPATDKVESAETFDAGIAMYVGMSVMAAAGSAVVLKKKD